MIPSTLNSWSALASLGRLPPAIAEAKALSVLLEDSLISRLDVEVRLEIDGTSVKPHKRPSLGLRGPPGWLRSTDMALPYGDWTATVNGAETILHIDPPDAQGVFTGQIFGGRIKGFWNEAAQKIQFASYAEEGGGTTSPVFGIFEGYLFRTPLNPAPGRDVTATLVGSLFVSAQSVGLDVLPEIVPSSRKSTFGWMAQLSEAQ